MVYTVQSTNKSRQAEKGKLNIVALPMLMLF